MITILFGGGGSRAFWGGSFFPSNTLDRTLVYKCSKLSQRKPANRRRISGRRFSPSDFSRQVKLKPKTPDVLAGYHKGWGFPRGIYSEIHSPITIPEITCDPQTSLSEERALSISRPGHFVRYQKGGIVSWQERIKGRRRHPPYTVTLFHR